VELAHALEVDAVFDGDDSLVGGVRHRAGPGHLGGGFGIHQAEPVVLDRDRVFSGADDCRHDCRGYLMKSIPT